MSGQQSFMPDDAPALRSKRRSQGKPFRLEWRQAKGSLFPNWSTYAKYANAELAETNLEAARRKYGEHWEFRLAAPRVMP